MNYGAGRLTSRGVLSSAWRPLPRHPSQLYEAVLEGLVLVTLAYVLIRWFEALRRPGMIFGTFLAGYGIVRVISETVREPDAHIGF